MQPPLEDRLNIADVMTGWNHRDQAEWDQLRNLFHPDATMEITWFNGKATDFIDGSMRMSSSDIRTKHLFGAPVITFNGNKALTETNAIVIADNAALGLGCENHCRFVDRLVKHDGAWKIFDRKAVYDMGTFTFPYGIVEIDPAAVKQFPREYAPLAYLLSRSGFPVTGIYPTRGSDREKEVKASGKAWLAS